MTVNNVNALLTYTTSQTVPTGDSQEEIVKGSFDKLMSRMSDQLGELQSNAGGSQMLTQTTDVETASEKDTVPNDNDNQPAVTKDPAQSDKTQDAVQQDGNKEVAEKSPDVETETVQEEVEQKGEELIQDIAEEMNVTPEEVEAAMEVLGLTVIELFDTDNLKQLLLNLSGSADELSLVTNETLYGNLQNLLETVEEDLGIIAEDLGLSKEELNTLLTQVVSEQQETDVQDMTPEPETPEPETPEVNLEGMKDYTVSIQRDGETVQMKVTVDDASGAKSVTEEVTDTPEVEVQSFSKHKENNASDMDNRGEGNSAGSTLLQTSAQQIEVNEVQTAEPVFQSAQTEEIMDQIMEYMKINLKADTQELEMQLHPASLGTVNVQIAAKDGVLTAHFTTQNETVRAVIETQLIQLKTQFEEQGIKVDAVEVTVANHAYGEQFSEQNENMGQEQGKTKKGIRRINLNEIGEEEDLDMMEDSERIAVEMMQANGNTVDYTA